MWLGRAQKVILAEWGEVAEGLWGVSGMWSAGVATRWGHFSRECMGIMICRNYGSRGHVAFECPSGRYMEIWDCGFECLVACLEIFGVEMSFLEKLNKQGSGTNLYWGCGFFHGTKAFSLVFESNMMQFLQLAGLSRYGTTPFPFLLMLFSSFL